MLSFPMYVCILEISYTWEVFLLATPPQKKKQQQLQSKRKIETWEPFFPENLCQQVNTLTLIKHLRVRDSSSTYCNTMLYCLPKHPFAHLCQKKIEHLCGLKNRQDRTGHQTLFILKPNHPGGASSDRTRPHQTSVPLVLLTDHII